MNKYTYINVSNVLHTMRELLINYLKLLALSINAVKYGHKYCVSEDFNNLQHNSKLHELAFRVGR